MWKNMVYVNWGRFTELLHRIFIITNGKVYCLRKFSFTRWSDEGETRMARRIGHVAMTLPLARGIDEYGLLCGLLYDELQMPISNLCWILWHSSAMDDKGALIASRVGSSHASNPKLNGKTPACRPALIGLICSFSDESYKGLRKLDQKRLARKMMPHNM